jgi:hypothetical protein
MVVLKANNQWKKFLLTFKNQHKVEVTNMPNADLEIFVTCQLLDLNSLIYRDVFRKPRKGFNALDKCSAGLLDKSSFPVQVNFYIWSV